VRVALAEDQVLLREGLARLLAEAGMEVVLQAGDAETLLAGIERTRPHVAIVDIRLPPDFSDEGLRAADAIREIHPDVAVLVLSQHLETAYAIRLLERFPGGVGYLLKDRVAKVAVLTDAIERLAEGECVIDPTIIKRLVGRPGLEVPLAELTERERDVLGLMAEGRSNRAIAGQLFLSEKTVEGNVRRIFDKLNLVEAADDNRRVLAVLAFLRR
jgi:DNA-binding NarL/FixJ family response regulator